MSDADFVRWEDLDLDYFLGDYTDKEIEEDVTCTLSSDDSDNDINRKTQEIKPPPNKKICSEKKAKQSAPCKPTYVCPICKKEVRSVSGFRGHVAKQHSRPDLKAYDHKKGEKNVTTPLNKPSTPFIEIFETSVRETLQKIKTDKLHNLQNACFGSAIVDCSSQILTSSKEEIFNPLKEPFQKLFENDNLSQPEREVLFCKFHALRMDHRLRETITNKLPGKTPPRIGKMFYQCFLLELLNTLIEAYKQCALQQASSTDQELTEVEQEIVYYVSGYILRRAATNKKINRELVSACTADENTASTCKPSAWTQKVNRGGLYYPSEEFFSMVKNFDRDVTKNCTTVGPNMLKRDILIEILMDSATTKHLWDELCLSIGISTSESLATLEYFVKVFLAIKGHATAQRLRTDHGKKLSLRHSLKKKGISK